MTPLLQAIFVLAQAPVTYSEHIAPLLNTHCAPCHRPGEAAPFPLLTYRDASRRAAQIAAVTRRRYMPPWPPEPGHGDFAGARRLKPEDLSLLARWAAAGAPVGDPSKTPPAPTGVAGWYLGEPDLILKLERPYSLAAGGKDVFRNFVIRTPLKETRYIRAMELRPGRRDLVHHANVILDRTRMLRARETSVGSDSAAGFEGMDVSTESEDRFDPDSHFLFWKPGTPPEALPERLAWRLDPGDDLVLNLHLRPSGKPETVEASVGLYFAKGPATQFPMLLQLEHDGAIDIPAGSKTTVVTDHLVLPIAVELLAIYPHAHYLGKRFEAWADLPGGGRRSLLRIEDWDINWQASYTYKQPIALPAGTRLGMRIAYDNSEANVRNPQQPPRRVRSGNRSEDEMGHVWFQVLPAASGKTDPRLLLQMASMRRRLEKYPNDFLAHFNLATAMQGLGQDTAAIPVLERAIAIRPSSAAAHNNLGTSLLLTERGGAEAEFRRALEADPDYGPARYNLARILMGEGALNAAVVEFDRYLSQKPDDVEARVHLGGLYATRKEFAQAARQLQIAVTLRHNDAELWTNLGTAQALSGDLRSAIVSFEAALKIDSSIAATRQNLERAKAAIRQ